MSHSTQLRPVWGSRPQEKKNAQNAKILKTVNTPNTQSMDGELEETYPPPPEAVGSSDSRIPQVPSLLLLVAAEGHQRSPLFPCSVLDLVIR